MSAGDDERAEALSLRKSVEVTSHLDSKRGIVGRARGKVRVPFLDERSEEHSMLAMKVRRKLEDMGLRRIVAWFTVGAVGLQLVASNVFFLIYLLSNRAEPDRAIMLGWMSSSVIEIVGILVIVAGSLFPNKNGKSKSK